MKDLLLGIDIGTTGTKAALFDLEGVLHAFGESEYGTAYPHAGWAEQNPEDWWRALCKAVGTVLSSVDGGPRRVAGVAVSSQAPTMLPVDRAGSPLRPALIWMDRRAEGEAKALARILGEGVIERVSGNRPDPFYVAPKIRWYGEREPELFSATALFVQINGYAGWKLTGRHALDEVHAALLQLRDYETGRWSEELCAACRVEPARFPPVRPCHEVLGEVTRDAGRETGLMPGTPVMVGTVDGAAAALEAGAFDEGTAAEMTGTSTVLLMPSARRVKEPVFIAMPHCVPGKYLLLGAMAATGASLRWFRDIIGMSGDEAYGALAEEASHAAAGSGGVVFLPYMMGERSPIWNTNARGVFFGLSLSTDRGDMVRAVLEGTAFALRHNVAHARRAGVDIAELRSVGGGTRSGLWNQIKADVLGVPILLPETSVGAAFGDAMLAGMGLGVITDIEGSLRSLVKIRARYEPDPARHERYGERYGVYRSLYEDLKERFDEAAALEGRS